MPQVFDLQVNAVANALTTSDVVLNGQQLYLPWYDNQTKVTTSFKVEDSLSGVHFIDVAVSGQIDPREVVLDGEHLTQTLTFDITSVDRRPTQNLGFVLIAQPTSPRRMKSIVQIHQPIDFGSIDDFFSEQHSDTAVLDADADTMLEPHHGEVRFDLAAEIETLSLLESLSLIHI